MPDEAPDLSHIAEGLHPLAVPIEDVRPLDGNPRRGDVEAVARSLKQFGFRQPITAQVSTRQVTAGNHRLLAARSLGWAHVPVLWVDEDDASALAWSIADNRTAALGEIDEEALALMVAEVEAEDASLLAAASFSEADLDELLASTAPAIILDDDDDDDDAMPDASGKRSSGGDEFEPFDGYSEFESEEKTVPGSSGAQVHAETGDWVVLRIADLRLKVKRSAYVALQDRLLREAKGDRAGALKRLGELLGFEEEEMDVRLRV